MIKVYKVSIVLNPNGCSARVVGYDMRETDKTYVIDKPSNFGGKTTVLKKEQLGVIDRLSREDSFYYTNLIIWCLSENIEKAKVDLKQAVHTKISEMKKSIKLAEDAFYKLGGDGQPCEFKIADSEN